MSETNDVLDPRAKIGHQITSGQVYKDDRNGKQYRIIYEDDQVVILRYETDNGPRHTLESRHHFEDNVGSGRFTLTDPTTSSPRMPDDFDSIRALVRRLHKYYKSQGNRVGNHKAKAMTELYDELNDLADGEDDPIDFASIAGIGKGAARNLKEAGFVTRMDVARTDKEAIMSVPLMGEKNTEALLEEVNV